MSRPPSDTTPNMPSHPWGDFAGLAQEVIHDAEIQVNPLLPGAMPQFPEGPRRDQHKYCDRYLSSVGARQQQLACLHAMQMALHQGRKAHCSVACRANTTALGRKPAEKQPAGSGQWGRSGNIFHRSNMQRQKMVTRLGPGFSGWTNNTWAGAGGSGGEHIRLFSLRSTSSRRHL